MRSFLLSRYSHLREEEERGLIMFQERGNTLHTNIFGSDNATACPSGPNLSKDLYQVCLRSVSSLKAILAYFVGQSEPKILCLVNVIIF